MFSKLTIKIVWVIKQALNVFSKLKKKNYSKSMSDTDKFIDVTSSLDYEYNKCRLL